jgi:hypothetical protein|tara:strand:+ start:253 stop:495 length:243 start_codon:yes stop_codon:yes gene_type:complete
MAEFLDRLVNARDSRTGWVKETASSLLSLKTRFESGDITESKYVEGLEALTSGSGEVGSGGSYEERAIIDNGIIMLKKLL